MKCLKCPKEAAIPYPNGNLCQECFIEMLVSRIKKEIRSEQPFNKNEKVLIFGRLTEAMFHKVIENLPLDVTRAISDYNPSNGYPEYDKVVIPWTADDEAALFYKELTKSDPDFEKIGQSKGIVKLFKSILDKELKQAAKILDIVFIPNAKDQDLEKINKKYPSSNFGLVKSAAEFKKALQ